MRRIVLGICIPLCLMAAGCQNARQTREILIEETLSEEVSSGRAEETAEVAYESEQIYVHVCGSVVNPGVYALEADARGNMAVEAAGGFSPDAAQDGVNLAKPLSDGQMLYIPTKEEAEQAKEEARLDALGLVNINKADEKKLMELPGIGQARAQQIVRYRQLHGGFRSIEELKKIDGIKESVYEKVKDKITIE